MTMQTRISRGINAQGQIVETVVEYDPDVVAARKAARDARQLAKYISDKSTTLRRAGITVSGIPVGTDAEGMILLTGAHDMLSANPSATLQFVASSTLTVTLNAIQVAAMWGAVTAFVQACFAAEATANAGLNASPPTITTTAQVDAIFAAVATAY